MKYSIYTVFFSFCVHYVAFSQTGTLRGTVIDDATGFPLIGVAVVQEGTTNGTITDLEGKYTLSLEEGVHTIILSYLAYSTQKVEEILIQADKVHVVDVRMKEQTELIQEVVVTAKALQNTEAAILTIQKKSANLLDGISSQTFNRTGDGNAAQAIQRVTGVSIEEGRYVYVRGLGDRYTKTILNGMEIPGLDPDRNTVQMDIFPTNLIDNIVVYKTFTPDLSGDFTGGMVNVATKDFPNQKTIRTSIGLSYNPSMHFNPGFILYNGGKLDGLGIDDGNRSLPFSSTQTIPDPALNDPELTTFTNSFNKEMAVRNKKTFLDQNYSFSIGNQVNKERLNIGYNAALTYQNIYEFYENVEYGEYIKNADKTVYQLDKERVSTGPMGVHNVLWSGLVSGAIKKENHKLSLQFLHSQNGTSTAAKFQQNDFDATGAELRKDNLSYSQRSISNAFLTGKHQLQKISIDWKHSFTYAKVYDPDLRTTAFSYDAGQYSLNSGDGAQVSRTYRDLNEMNESIRLDISYSFQQWSGLESTLKGGVLNTWKQRDFEVLTYDFRSTPGFSEFNGDPNMLFEEENIWTVETDEGIYVRGNKEPANTFSSASNVFGIYIMNELPLQKRLKAIYGLRIEKANNWYTGTNNSQTEVYEGESVLNEIDFLPSWNIIYNVIEDMNIRTSYSRTLSRPSFREISIAQIYDPIQDRTYIGNIDLEETHIQNVDIRWEYFLSRGEMLSVSGFYKQFKNPIEIVAFENAPNNVQPRNVGNGNVYGIELEVKKNLAFIHESLSDLSLGSNITWAKSEITMSDEEYESRLNAAREAQNDGGQNEEISRKRAMLGQSPYIVNAYINYTNQEAGLDMTLSYNVQGKRLSVVGNGRVPDVFEQSFHGLNFKISEKFGQNQQYTISLNAQNLIGDRREKLYQSYQADHAIYEAFSPGRNFGIGFSYLFR